MSIVVTHWPVPTQPPPDQPSKYDSAPGVALSVTTVPWLYVSLRSVPQSILPSVDFTVPALAALPVFATVNEYALTVNVAVVVIGAAVVVNMHVVDAEPSQGPPAQFENTEPACAAAVSVTMVPVPKFAEQELGVPSPQSMPVGFDTIEPAPVPPLMPVSEALPTLNVAVTVVAAVSVIAQVPVPGQFTPVPDQPANTEPPEGD